MKNDADIQIVITINGPGEVACLLYPLAATVKEEVPGVRICVALLPGVFSTGAEAGVVAEIPFVDAVCSARETRGLIFQNRLPEGFRKRAAGFVLHLGGDPFLTWLTGKRLRQPCLAYVESPFSLQSRFDKVFYSGSEAIAAKAGVAAPEFVGELMVDAAWMRCPARKPFHEGRLTVGLYPGSREYIAEYMLPFFASVVDAVSVSLPDVQWVLAKADFLPMEFLRNLPVIDDDRPLEGENPRFEENEAEAWLTTAGGQRIEIFGPSEVAAQANLALTVPGSNTAELATLGVAMVVALPTYWGETSQLPGLAEHVGGIPLIGKYMEHAISHQYRKRMKYTAHPNRRASRMIVPEVVGEITARQVADVLITTLMSDTNRMEEELRKVMGEPGASKRLVDKLRDYLEAQALQEAGAHAS